MLLRANLLTLGVVSALVFGATIAAADPPFRVARLSVAEGSVSYLPGDSDEWRPAVINYPLTAGDTLWSDRGSRAELHIGSTAIRLGDETSAGFLNLDDRTVQIRVTQGILQVHIRRLDSDQVFEVDTPNGAVSLLRPGDYRIDAFPEGSGTVVAVRNGEAEVTGGGTAFPIQPAQTARIYGGVDQLQYDLVATVPPDAWDQWCHDRDRYEDEAAQQVTPYVSREVSGYEDLAGHGVWTESPDYGPVWTPTVNAGWAPYRYGHWAYIAPWGWTWVDDAPWGFAPFHYGRWAQWRGVWVWVPGPVVSRPVYAPALVVFVGGPHLGGGGVAWFPLGPREVYRPGYRVSETYVRNVNVTNVRNINVTSGRYINREVGTTAVSQNVFVSQRSVHREALRIPSQELQQAEVVGTAPAGIAAPPARSAGPAAGNVARPSRAVVDRQVVVRRAPPSGDGSFRPTVRPMQTLVRQAPPATVQPRAAGEQQQQSNPSDRYRRFGDNARPDRPATPADRVRTFENRPAAGRENNTPANPAVAAPAERARPERPVFVQQQPQPTPTPQAERVRPERPQPSERARPERPSTAPDPAGGRVFREDRPRPSPERVQERREQPRQEQRQEQRREERREGSKSNNDDRKPKDK